MDSPEPTLCEKPLGVTSRAAWDVVDREITAGRRYVQVGFMRRYDPGFVQLKKVVSAGEVGDPLLVHSIHRNASSATSTTNAGIVTGSMIHELDTVPWLLDSRVRSVRVESPRASGLRDPQIAWLYLVSGAIATIEVFVNAQYGYEVDCEVVGAAGVANLPARSAVTTRLRGLHAHPVGGSFVDHFADAYREQLVAWVARRGAIEDDTPSAWDGYLATLVAETAICALLSGSRCEVPLVEPPSLYRPKTYAGHA